MIYIFKRVLRRLFLNIDFAEEIIDENEAAKNNENICQQNGNAPLFKASVEFTKEQKELIESLAKDGKSQEAQEYIWLCLIKDLTSQAKNENIE